jgi:SAM-dependent methyltransferase
MVISQYYSERTIEATVAAGRHREIIGGMFEEHGEHQLAFLIGQGLKPDHRVLDIGCGSLRFGVPAVRYLDAGNYFGTDISQSLINAGYDRELTPANLANKLPRANLVTDGNFAFSGVPNQIDYVVAQSVFTHLPLNHVRLCLTNLADHVDRRCVFFFSFYSPKLGEKITLPAEQFPGVVTWSHQDPYHHSVDDFHYASSALPWSLEVIGEWGHPKKQLMMKATLER